MAGDRRTRLIVFAGAALVAVLAFRLQAPKEQHVRIVLGPKAPRVTGVTVDLHERGAAHDPLRTARFGFAAGAAPRVVNWDMEVPSGTYGVHLEADTTEGRRTVDREVTLAEGTASVDIVEALP